MKQKHIFLSEVMYDPNEELIQVKVIQGPVKREFGTVYVVDDNKHDQWIRKDLFKKFDVYKDEFTPDNCLYPIIHYRMGFIWKDGDDQHYVSYMASECQRLCKNEVRDQMRKRQAEIDNQITKLDKSTFLVRF